LKKCGIRIDADTFEQVRDAENIHRDFAPCSGCCALMMTLMLLILTLITATTIISLRTQWAYYIPAHVLQGRSWWVEAVYRDVSDRFMVSLGKSGVIGQAESQYFKFPIPR
jgi:hypothetical protein